MMAKDGEGRKGTQCTWDLLAAGRATEVKTQQGEGCVFATLKRTTQK